MARPFPYTFISCPCADVSGSGYSHNLSRDLSGLSVADREAAELEEEERTFDPRSKRANYSLYPPEHLLYCEDCHQIKCPRCVTEEVVCWYCPNCLFETPSSMVRSEGNRYGDFHVLLPACDAKIGTTDRCARNCFNCPSCTSPLSVTAIANAENASSQNGPWILSCGYCMWSSLDIGIKFNKPTNIRAQLASLKKGHERTPKDEMKSRLSSFTALDDRESGSVDEEDSPRTPTYPSMTNLDHESRFKALKTFYRDQIAETSSSPTDPLMGSDLGGYYGSPSALNRIMSLYTSGVSGLGSSSKKPKTKPPVMREAVTEAEGLLVPPDGVENAAIQKMATEGWESIASMEQRLVQRPGTQFVDDLLPLPVLLRTKRSKRCKSCKHILVKPEFKPQSTRFRIRLIALSYIPLTNLRPLLPPVPAAPPNLEVLEPNKPVQFLLTLKNHMFDPVKVTLATPSSTPGRVNTKVTILCPEFDVGANTDVWDEALQSGNAPDPRSSRSGFEKVAEAGKVWDKGRNWTTVAMEVVPGSLVGLPGDPQLKEDEDVLEIPIFVRIEWEGEAGAEHDVDTVKREVAYWMVLGVGRIMGGRI